jgi:asparagine synthase (glutamine-hydrolysing)
LASFNGQIYGSIGKNSCPTGLKEEIVLLEDNLESVDGMYACSLCDPSGESVTLLTDPYFIKPLFYRVARQGIAFCSELTPLLRIGSNAVQREALAEIFSFGWTLDDATWLSDIHMVCRNNVQLHRDRVRKILKHRTNNVPMAPPSSCTIRSAISQSVRRCVIGRGPFGLAVSGGLDSTILAWELNKAEIEGLVTISVRLSEADDGIDSLCELDLPKGGSWTTWRHRTVTISPRELFEEMRQSILLFGQPTTMSSLPLSRCLAHTAHQEGVSVLITGEGADELFGGYASYANLADGDIPTNYYRNATRERIVGTLFGDDVLRQTYRRFMGLYQGCTDLRAIELDLRLPRLLLRTDITLMAYSIEGRTPFLHSGIPDLALAIPWGACGNGRKQALRDAYADELGRRSSKPKTRFRLTDTMLQCLFREEHIQKSMHKTLRMFFGATRSEQALNLLQSDREFDADTCCLVMSLTFLIEAGVLA